MNLKPTIRCRTFRAWLNHMNTTEEYKSPKERRKDKAKEADLFNIDKCERCGYKNKNTTGGYCYMWDSEEYKDSCQYHKGDK